MAEGRRLTSTVHVGHVLDVLRTLPAGSVQTVVTSPPYYGLRDYGTGDWAGGDPDCDHRPDAASRAQRPQNGLTGGTATVDASTILRRRCRCGAERVDGQIGLEETPDEYVAKLVDVFREVHRVLRTDGTVWLNLGDSYAASGTTRWPNTTSGYGNGYGKHGAWHGGEKVRPGRGEGIKAKDLLMIPAMVALALRADGWYLRSDVIWAKPNPMPESVGDRPTTAHEHIFLLAKSKSYYYDAFAIREQATYAGPHSPPKSPYGQGFAQRTREQELDRQRQIAENAARVGASSGRRLDGFNDRWNASEAAGELLLGRNKRNVWTIGTQPYNEAHFATFPPRLIEPCILAGSSPYACADCGAPWRRVLERDDTGWDGSEYGERAVAATGGAVDGGTARSTLGSSNGKLVGQPRSAGWEPTCRHDTETAPSMVLDPFCGSGTVGVVCGWHGRDFVGIDLNPEYADMARRRILREGRPGARHEPPVVHDDQLALEM